MAFNFSEGSNSDWSTPASYQSLKPIGAPYWILLIGVLLTPMPLALLLLIPGAPTAAIPLALSSWLLCLAFCLLPLAAFTVVDLKRRSRINYSSSGGNRGPALIRIFYLVYGLGISVIPNLELAQKLASLAQVILG